MVKHGGDSSITQPYWEQDICDSNNYVKQGKYNKPQNHGYIMYLSITYSYGNFENNGGYQQQ